MKQSLFILLGLMLSAALPQGARGQFNCVTNNGSVTITGYTGPGGIVTIPGAINGFPVTGIGASAFAHNSAVTGVTITNSVTSIGFEAFYYCTSLTNVAIPNSVTNIGAFAFFGCFALPRVAIPAAVAGIGQEAFIFCPSLLAITVDAQNPVYSSVDGVLFDKTGTTLLEFPGGVGGIYTVPAGVTNIGDYAFQECDSLTGLVLPDGLFTIGFGAFNQCFALESVTIPASVTSIGPATFFLCTSLTAIGVDPQNLFYTSVNGVVFDKNLDTLVAYPGGLGGEYSVVGSVTSIGQSAFSGCTSLTNVSIPASVTSIGDNAFYYCTSLTGVYFQGNAPAVGSSVFLSDANASICYPPGTTGWSSPFAGIPAGPCNPLNQPGAINVYSTGLDDQYNRLVPGSADGHYVIVSAPAGVAATPFSAWLPQNTNGCPFNGAWLNDDAASQWVAVQSNYTCFTQDPVGTYDFRTTFDLTGQNPASAALSFKYLADNLLQDVLINGQSAGLSLAPPPDFVTWLGPFEITNNFVAGTNTLDFIVYNSTPGGGNPCGLRVQISGSALSAEGPPEIITPPASQTNVVGSPVTFAISVVGTTPLSYQWSFDNNPISGATNTAYSIASIQGTNGGLYSVTVTNVYGATNASATLTVASTNAVTPLTGWPVRDRDVYGSRNGGYATVGVDVSTYGAAWSITNASLPLTGNVLGGSSRQLVANVPGGIGIFDITGARQGFIATAGQVACLADVNGDGTPEILAVQMDASYNFQILVYQGDGTLLKTIQVAGTGQSDQTVMPLFAADLYGDGQVEIVSQLTSGYGVGVGGLRGWEVTRYATGQRLWRSIVGPIPDAVRWANVPGNSLLAAGWGPYNGNSGSDGTADDANYTWSYAPATGLTGWIRSYASGGFYDSGVYLPDLNGDGTREILATTTLHGWSLGDYGYGELHVLNPNNGADVSSLSLGHYLDFRNAAFGNLDGVPGDEVVVATYEGATPVLRAYGSNLAAKGSYSRASGLFTPVAVADLAGTGTEQVLAMYQPASGNDRLVILNGALTQVLWEADFGVPTIQNVVVDDLDQDGKLEIIVQVASSGGVTQVLVLDPGAHIVNPQTGSLQVFISPGSAIKEGAQWQVDAGAAQGSGDTVTNLPAGSHTVSFTDISGWVTPSNLTVTITNGATTAATGLYTPVTVPGAGLVLLTNGPGTIQHRPWPQDLTVGKRYTVIAVPTPGNLFSDWVGGTGQPYSVLSTSARYTFTMEPNLVLEANFATNPFTAARGVYFGLFAPAGGARSQDNSGSFTFTLTRSGALSGRLRLGSENVPLAGRFSPDGSAAITSTRRHGSALTTDLQLDFANQSVTGTVSDGSFVASLYGYQNVFSSRNKAAAYQGRYTLIIPGTTNPAVGPYGASFGTVTVGASGNVLFVGSLADGTPVSQSSVLSQGGLWPIYLPLYGGKGSLWGWNLFTNQSIFSFANSSWINSGNASKVYASGFTNQEAEMTGSAYDGTGLLDLASGEVMLTGGDLSVAMTNQVVLQSNGRITPADAGNTNRLALKLNRASGLISGSFANPSDPRKRIKFNGVVMQNETNAAGYFLGTDQSGLFELAQPGQE